MENVKENASKKLTEVVNKIYELRELEYKYRKELFKQYLIDIDAPAQLYTTWEILFDKEWLEYINGKCDLEPKKKDLGHGYKTDKNGDLLYKGKKI